MRVDITVTAMEATLRNQRYGLQVSLENVDLDELVGEAGVINVLESIDKDELHDFIQDNHPEWLKAE